ncbi:beta-lactamase family protein [Streptomyces triculaminicus]|uniref:Beta-lactamase family protein n=1 Tax=Streptomyces triculaminicus TaxID=2816232 RepID=A0A939FN53_9ACTN|nr:beta-lactamase family protein [Streptomyces triculaminicus]
MRPTRSWKKQWWLRIFASLGVSASITLTAVAFLAPRPAHLSGRTTGDRQLAERVRTAVGASPGYRGLSVAFLDRDQIRLAGLGDSGNPERPDVDESTVFEAGSLGKPMTGMLLAELSEHDGLPLDSPLERLLPSMQFDDPALKAVTLRDLASHRSGLDQMPSNIDMFLRDTSSRIFGNDPYRGLTEKHVFAAAENAAVSSVGRFQYSNLGMALAGHTAARVVGKPYVELLKNNVLTPLQMNSTRIVQREADIPARSATGQKAAGATMQHWIASGYSPAGDIWTTSKDMALLLRSVALGVGPGADAATPRFDAGHARQIGLGWYTTSIEGRDITWHDGATGGFTSYMGFDRNSKQGVVVLSNTDQPVVAIGQRLLGLTPDGPQPRSPRTAVTLLCIAGAALPALYVMLLRRPTALYRTYLMLSLAFGTTLLVLVRRLGDWLTVPPTSWALGCGLLALAACQSATKQTSTASHPHAPSPLKTTLLGSRYAMLLLALLLLATVAVL